ncbi:MAG: hypothetical protein KGY70_11535 [Bacteroidales bacterium]|nr:hypothetical protein [Bacteroidales bacterium]
MGTIEKMKRDRFQLAAILQAYPPTNPILLDYWFKSTSNFTIKVLIQQWMKVLNGTLPSIHYDVFEVAKNELEVLNRYLDRQPQKIT